MRCLLDVFAVRGGRCVFRRYLLFGLDFLVRVRYSRRWFRLYRLVFFVINFDLVISWVWFEFGVGKGNF